MKPPPAASKGDDPSQVLCHALSLFVDTLGAFQMVLGMETRRPCSFPRLATDLLGGLSKSFNWHLQKDFYNTEI